MGISLYYTARRQHGLSDSERDAVEHVLTEANEKLVARLNRNLPRWKEDGTVPSSIEDASQICEGLHLHLSDAPDVILDGSSKVSHGSCGMEPLMEQVEYYTQCALPRLRQALPGAAWWVHLDDHDLTWDEENGEYSLS
ncbi:hypothetical protein NOGI109294_20120 [Nocardiopsis gilva]